MFPLNPFFRLKYEFHFEQTDKKYDIPEIILLLSRLYKAYLSVPPGVGNLLDPRPTVTTLSRNRSSSTSSRDRENGPPTRVCAFLGFLVGRGIGIFGNLAPLPPHPSDAFNSLIQLTLNVKMAMSIDNGILKTFA